MLRFSNGLYLDTLEACLKSSFSGSSVTPLTPHRLYCTALVRGRCVMGNSRLDCAEMFDQTHTHAHTQMPYGQTAVKTQTHTVSTVLHGVCFASLFCSDLFNLKLLGILEPYSRICVCAFGDWRPLWQVCVKKYWIKTALMRKKNINMTRTTTFRRNVLAEGEESMTRTASHH